MICGSILRYSYSSRFLIVVSPLTAVKFESDIAAKRNVAQVNFACGDRVFEINAAEGRGDSERVMFPAYAHLSAYDRHKKLVNDYLMFYGKSVSSFKRDMYVEFFIITVAGVVEASLYYQGTITFYRLLLISIDFILLRNSCFLFPPVIKYWEYNRMS